MVHTFIRYSLKIRLWLVEKLHWGELPSTLFWAGLAGFGGGLLSTTFRHLIHIFQWLLTHHEGGLVYTATSLLWWQRLLIPGVGGLAAGLIIHFGIKLSKKQKTSDYMEAVVVKNGEIGVRSTLIKSLSSLFTIASGGSIGREGPMVTLSAMFASIIGRLRHFSPQRHKLLVACGAAAGIASAYNAPIAGALFVAEIILGSIAMEMFGPLVFSSVVATITVHQILGTRPTYEIPPFHLASNWEFFLFIALGIIAGLISPLFLKLLNLSEAFFLHFRLPIYWRFTLGGIIVGIISVSCPEVWGNGYSVVNSILSQDWLIPTLLFVFLCKLLATASTVGSGAVGGVFTPTLFFGAVIGCIFGKATHFILPNLSNEGGAYALIGMGCFLAATTLAPLMAILMIFEMTLQYDVVLPLMLGCVSAYFTAKNLKQNSIYEEHLRRKRNESSHPATSLPTLVHDLLKSDALCISPQTSFGEIAQLFSENSINYLYVVEKENRFLGVVSLHDMKPYLNDASVSSIIIAHDFMRKDFPLLTPEQSLSEALPVFSRYKLERIPVVNNVYEKKLLGILSKTDLLLALAENVTTTHHQEP